MANTNQGLRQESVRAVTGTTLSYNGDWLALFALSGINTGNWNGDLLTWINLQLGTTYNNLSGAMAAFAISQGFDNWGSMGTFNAGGGGAGLVLGETDALGIDFSTPSASQQVYIVDTVTPANNYSGAPTGKLTYTSPSAKLTRRASGTWTLTNGTTELPYEWNAAGTLLGLRLEEARTNLLLRSAEFANLGAWSLSQVTVTSNATTAPDGTVTADTVIPSTSSAVHFDSQSVTVVASTVYTISVFAKAAGYSWLSINFRGGASGNHAVNFDLTNGVLGSKDSAAFISQQIVNANNGWYRCSVTRMTEVGQVAIDARFYPASSDNPDSGQGYTPLAFVGDGTSGISLWGGQIEAGAFATSQIGTTTVSVTRAADNLSLATSAFGYSAAVGTLYAKFAPFDVSANRFAMAMDDGTANERLAIGSDSNGLGMFTVVDGGAPQTAPLTNMTIAAELDNKVAASWAANDFALSTNGRTAVVDTAGTLPTVTSLRFGSGASAASPLNGYLAQVAYFKRTLSDAELATKTAMTATVLANSVGRVTNVGATVPLYGSITESGVYVASQSKTYLGFEGWSGSARKEYVTSYNHSTGLFDPVVDTGMTVMVDDDHGVPAIMRDHEGYWHAFGGGHGLVIRHQSTNAANDISAWTSRTTLGPNYAYPKPVLVGSTIYLFLRMSADPQYHYHIRTTATLSSGVATWNADQSLIDFSSGANERVYAGNFRVVGTEIWFVAQRSPQTDTDRQDLYFFRYDTTTGSIKNYDGSVTVVTGSQPVTRTQSDASFRIFQHTGSNKNIDIPLWVIDGSNIPYVFFGDGLNAGPFDIKMTYPSGGSWLVEDTGVDVQNRYDVIAPVRRSTGVIDLYYPATEWTSNFAATGIPIGGNLARVSRTGTAAWGASQTILTPVERSIGRAMPVLAGHDNAQIFITEISTASTDAVAGNCRLFLYGDNGFLAR